MDGGVVLAPRCSSLYGIVTRVWLFTGEFGGARRSQEESGGVRSSQEAPEGAMLGEPCRADLIAIYVVPDLFCHSIFEQLPGLFTPHAWGSLGGVAQILWRNSSKKRAMHSSVRLVRREWLFHQGHMIWDVNARYSSTGGHMIFWQLMDMWWILPYCFNIWGSPVLFFIEASSKGLLYK